MREGEPTSDYIWLRQSVTFTANGQTRTLEIAVPVRPNATPAEVESLLTQAQAGMTQLTQALDARVEAALSPQSAPAAASSPAAAAQRPATPVAAAPLHDQHDHAEHEAPQPPAPAIRQPAAAPPASAAPARSAPVQPPTSPAPAASQPRPTPIRPLSPSPVPSAAPSAARTAPPMPGRANETRPSAPAPTASGPELSRPEFLAAVAQLGLKPKDAMDRLGVRTLEGLNLREALESLRRQMLRSPAEPARTPPARAEASRAEAIATPSQASRAPVQFDEEEDADFTFTVDEEGVLEDLDEDESATGEPGGPTFGASPDELNDLDLDDVPDFGPPPGRAGPPASSSRAPARAASPRASAAPSAASSTAPSTAPSALATPASAGKATAARGAANARALDRVKQMRSASAGGTSSAQQRTAYRNIIVTEIGEANARALIQGLWRVTPERLGPDQYDGLISWGKQDTFADEVPLVLAALDAERQAAREQAGGEAEASGSASRTTPSTPRPRPGATGTSRGDR